MLDKTGKQIDWELKNTVHICHECSEKMRKDWQKRNRRLKIREGDFVKVAIKDENQIIENLWFEVLTINKKCPTCKSKKIKEIEHKEYTHICEKCGDEFCEFVGRCDNVPLEIENIKLDGITHFKFKDIGNYLPK